MKETHLRAPFHGTLRTLLLNPRVRLVCICFRSTQSSVRPNRIYIHATDADIQSISLSWLHVGPGQSTAVVVLLAQVSRDASVSVSVSLQSLSPALRIIPSLPFPLPAQEPIFLISRSITLSAFFSFFFLLVARPIALSASARLNR